MNTPGGTPPVWNGRLRVRHKVWFWWAGVCYRLGGLRRGRR